MSFASLPDDLPLIDESCLQDDAFSDVIDVLIAYYAEDSVRLVEDAVSAYHAGQQEVALRHIHTLKSSSEQMGLRRVGWIAAQLEALLQLPSGEIPSDQPDALFALLNEALPPAIDALRKSHQP